MAVPPADDDGRALSTPARSAGGRGRTVLTLVLAVALVASTIALGTVLWARRGADDDVQAERDRVMAQAEQFLLRIGTFGPDLLEGEQMPEFRERVSEVLTAKADEEFEAQVVVAEQLVAQQDAERTAEVFGTGVATLRDDTATALVAGAFTNAVDGEPGAPFPVYLRLELVLDDGTWLVDDFGPAVEDGEGGEDGGALPGATPSTTPSGEPSPQPSAQPSSQPSGGGR
ncbi:hypothetical protein QWY28_01695 [Nocardioides sp. SOB77]|uniref:Mce-associated membrane protein n=1 Tax=Nocardioides oceani TaxID=3058369 RepID=A0ABT8FB92_9ACTN|nr:hypothetical protein [Nocardioides oceani]MDN4171647.1 hypothetical protein [Nocardioides oceani]